MSKEVIKQRSDSDDGTPASIDFVQRTALRSSLERAQDYPDDIYKKLDPDKLIDAFGVYGFYQMFTYTLVQTLNFFYSSSIYIMSYIQMTLVLQCHETSTKEKLPIGDTCNIESHTNPNISFESLFDETCGLHPETSLTIFNETRKTNLLVEFDLTCAHWVIQELGLTVFTISAIFAVPLMCMLADKYGRRPVILISACVAFLANMMAAASPNFTWFLIARAVVGAASDTYLSVATVATCEFVSEKARVWIVLIYNVAWALGMLWVPVVTFITDDWRWRYAITSAPGIYCVLLYFFLPESPHWMLHHNKVDEIKKYIAISSKTNNKIIDLNDCILTEHYEKKHESLVALLKSPKMLMLLTINGFLQFAISLIYFAISFLSVDLSDDKITGYVFSSLLEIPGGIAAMPLMIWLGRRSLTSVAFILQGIALVIAGFVMDVHISRLIVMLIAKAIACIIYSVHPIWANEQFPTSVRSLAYSIMNIPQSMGIIASPYLKHLKTEPQWLPMALVGAMSICAGGVGFLLPETKSVPLLPDIRSLTRVTDEDAVSEVDEEERDRIMSYHGSPIDHSDVRVTGRSFAPTNEF